MKAIIIYGDMEFAERAEALLHRVGKRAEINIEWTVSFWSVVALGKTEFAQKAFAEAEDADLILFPAKLARSCPRPLLQWLEHWADLRRIPEAALAILDDPDATRVEVPVHPGLAKLIDTHGLTVIKNERRPADSAGKTPVLFEPDRRLPLPVELSNHGHHDRPGAYRSFGINE